MCTYTGSLDPGMPKNKNEMRILLKHFRFVQRRPLTMPQTTELEDGKQRRWNQEIAILEAFNRGPDADPLKRLAHDVEALNMEVVRLVASRSWKRGLCLSTVGHERRQAAEGGAVADCRALLPHNAGGKRATLGHLHQGVGAFCRRAASKDRPESDRGRHACWHRQVHLDSSRHFLPRSTRASR